MHVPVDAPPQSVPLSALRLGVSPRATPDEEHIRRLAQTEHPLPPILVHRSTMLVIDGLHRVMAARLRRSETIDVEFFEGSERDAFLLAVAENTWHGLPLSLAERKEAAVRIIHSHPELSDRAVAEVAGLAARTVASLRRRSSESFPQTNTRVGIDGRARPLNAAEGRRRAAEAMTADPTASLREIARRARVSLGTAHDVRVRMRRGESPLPAGADRSQPAAQAGASADAPPDEEALTDMAVMLRRLARDPALRQTEPGRELLQLLYSRALIGTEWRDLVDAIPPHCIDAVAVVARRCAESWNGIARAVELRGRPGDH
ncbi:ParB/RepB/Spo0J family partition protein [Actinomadura flavalba]|uniref:ParB/RepB/Spo0J family partition protein n=1 Tax=Actinomadura flavalba TaxID=1120938 RepID=UPI0003709508|nr:ParB/RepB/Spo0J family partition protein [Actinomadura flavalba]